MSPLRKSPSERRRSKIRHAVREGMSREEALQRFGAAADERVADRRTPKSTTDTERILAELGIADRRRVQRGRR